MDRGGFAPQRGVHLWCDPVQGRLCFLTSNPGVWGLAGAMPGWAGAQGWVHPPPSQCPCELGQAGPEHALWAARTWCSPMAEGDLMFSQGKKHSGPEQGPKVAGAQGRKCDGRDTGQGSGHSSRQHLGTLPGAGGLYTVSKDGWDLGIGKGLREGGMHSAFRARARPPSVIFVLGDHAQSGHVLFLTLHCWAPRPAVPG